MAGSTLKQRRRGPGRPFQKGVSGNPSGRPAVARDIQELCREKTPEAVAALMEALQKPGERVRAAEVLIAYGYGRPVQRQEHTGKDGGPIQTQTVEDSRPGIETFLAEFNAGESNETKH